MAARDELMAGRLELLFLGDPGDLRRAFGQLDSTAGTFEAKTGREGGRLRRLGHAAAGGLIAGAAAAGAAAKHAADAAADSEASTARLEAQMRASGFDLGHHAARIDAVVQETSRIAGLDDEDLQDAFTTMLRASGSVTKSLRQVGLVADLARAKNLDVAKAGDIVAKVMGGNVGILKRYGVQLDKDATSAQALAAMHDKFAGQAKTYGDTTQGAYDKFDVARENLEEVIGSKLTPALERLLTLGAELVLKAIPIVAGFVRAAGAVIGWTRSTADTVIGAVRGIPAGVRGGLHWAAGQIRDGVAAGLVPIPSLWMLRTAVHLIGRELGDELRSIGSSMIKGVLRALEPGALVKALIRELGGLTDLAGRILGDIGNFIAPPGVGGQSGMSDNMTLGHRMMLLSGWDESNWPALRALWIGESGWNHLARNASSGAYGIPQALPAEKMASAGADWRTNPATQIRWGLRYIKGRYGSPKAAYAFWLSQSPHWYGHGGDFITAGPTVFGAGENGPEHVAITPLAGRAAPPVIIRGPIIRSAGDAHALAARAAFLAHA